MLHTRLLAVILRKTNKADRAQFVPAFREYLITSYAQSILLYITTKKVEFAPAKDFSKERVVSVNTSVMEPRA